MDFKLHVKQKIPRLWHRTSHVTPVFDPFKSLAGVVPFRIGLLYLPEWLRSSTLPGYKMSVQVLKLKKLPCKEDPNLNISLNLVSRCLMPRFVSQFWYTQALVRAWSNKGRLIQVRISLLTQNLCLTSFFCFSIADCVVVPTPPMPAYCRQLSCP